MTETIQASIFVESVNQPAPGKKMGSIKARGIGTIWAWPNQLDKLHSGGTFTIKYKEDNNFKSVVEILHQEPQAAPPWEPPGQVSTQVTTTVDPLPERIFVCGVVNSAVSSGKEPTIANLIGIVNAARQAWAETFGKK